MTEPLISSPLAGAAAFDRDSDIAAWSQACHLIAAGIQLTGDGRLLDEAPPGLFRVPRLARPLRCSDVGQVLDRENVGYGYQGSTVAVTAAAGGLARAQARLLATGRADAAVAAIHLGMSSPHEVVRAASASEWTRVGEGPSPAESVLLAACRSSSPTVAAVAARAVERVSPNHRVLHDLADKPTRPSAGPATATTSLLVHGTFARLTSTWWRPGSEFFAYVKENVCPDLYDRPGGYRWTGRYRQADRDAAAADLAAWLSAGRLGLDTTLAHSHGGNAVLDALAAGLVRMRLLVLLSTPALRDRPDTDWPAIARNVGRVYALRVHCDLAVLGDRSRQEYPGPHVKTNVLPGIWFNHAAVLSPQVWRRFGLADSVKYEHGIAAVGSR